MSPAITVVATTEKARARARERERERESVCVCVARVESTDGRSPC